MTLLPWGLNIRDELNGGIDIQVKWPNKFTTTCHRTWFKQCYLMHSQERTTKPDQYLQEQLLTLVVCFVTENSWLNLTPILTFQHLFIRGVTSWQITPSFQA
jgi:hypothetical protein